MGFIGATEQAAEKGSFGVEFDCSGAGTKAPFSLLNNLWHPSTALRAGYEVVPLRTSTSRWSFSASYEVVPLRTSTSRWSFSASCEVVPLRTSTPRRIFPASCEVVPLRTSTPRWSFSASCEVVPFRTSMLDQLWSWLAGGGYGFV